MEYDGSVRISTTIDTTGIKTGVDVIINEFEKLNPILSDLTEAIAGIGKQAIESAPKADFGSGITNGVLSD